MKKEFKKKLFEKVLKQLGAHLILVEGKRDEAALHEVGITARVERAIGRPERVAQKIIDSQHGEKIVLLFDFDEEGERKTRVFQELFSNQGIPPNALLRKRFKQLFRVTRIEDLPHCFAKVLEEIA